MKPTLAPQIFGVLLLGAVLTATDVPAAADDLGTAATKRPNIVFILADDLGYTDVACFGGIRVPYIFRWPGKIASGAVRDEPINSVDLYPTLLEVADGKPPQDYVLDGTSYHDLLAGKSKAERPPLYWHFPGYLGAGDGTWRTTPAGAIRDGGWKLLEFFEDGRLELYNLKDDIGEKHNLAATEPRKVKELQTQLAAWRKNVQAPMPTKNTAMNKPEGKGTVPAAENDFTDLFNGKDLSGWVSEGQDTFQQGGEKRPIWTVNDGQIVCDGHGYGFLRYDKKQFSDFQIHVEYRMAKKCNSGLGIRTVKYTGETESRPSFAGYEIQILADAGTPPTPHSSGSLYRYVAPKVNATKAAGEWNVVDIECRGPKIRVTLNDRVIQDVDQSTVDSIKKKPLAGYFCLQNHGSRIEFKNLRVKEF